MNIETKTVGSDLNDYLNFGWKHTENTTVRSGRRHCIKYVLARDKDIENYRLIAALENKYFTLKSKKKYYSPIDPGWCFVGFVFFLLPGIIYVVVKSKQKASVNEFNEEIQKQMDDVLKEVRPLI